MSEGYEGYGKDVCFFCKGRNAGYRRGDDDNPKSNHDACEECARKPYPQPKQFENENKGESNEIRN